MHTPKTEAISTFELKGVSRSSLMDNGIIKVEVFDNVHFDIEITIRMAKQHLDLQSDKKNLTLAVLGKNISSPKETRDYSAGPVNEGFTAGMAILATNIISRNMVNFFMYVSRPKIPTRAFKCETEAAEWLLTLDRTPIKQEDYQAFMNRYPY